MQNVLGDELFEFVGMVFEALDDTGDAETTLFDYFLVCARDDVFEVWHDFFDSVEGVEGDVATTVCGGGDGCALDVGGEEVEVHETGLQSPLTNNRSGILDGNLLKSL